MPDSTVSQPDFATAIQAIGRAARSRAGTHDVAQFRRLKRLARASELAGRGLLLFVSGPWGWLAGVTGLAFSLSLESQLNHSVMHGAYAALPGAGDLSPETYESLALPFRSRTWGDAHRIHHALPSLLDQDPDTVHPLFRVHRDVRWRPWHLLNTILGAVFVFECWAFDYDRFLKERGKRSPRDRGEWAKFALFIGYQYVLFALLAGARWRSMLLGTAAACIMRNLAFVALQTASSVGAQVSTRHCRATGRKSPGEWTRFQVETSKNFVLPRVWRLLCGGLDRHIEHHLFPQLPPTRYHELADDVRALCLAHGVQYEEHPSIAASLRDSFAHLGRLSLP